MKKTLIYLSMITLLQLIVFTTAFPQNDSVQVEPVKNSAIGIRYGGMASDLWFPGTKAIDDKSYYCPAMPIHPLFSSTWGIFLNHNTARNIILNIDIMWTKKGRTTGSCPNQDYWPTVGPPPASPFDAITLNYLSLSTSVLFRTNGNIFAYGGLGLYNAFLVSSASLLDLHRPQYSGSGARRYDLGLIITAGIRIPINSTFAVNIEMHGTSSVIKVFTRSEIDAFGSEHHKDIIALHKTLSGTLSLSYCF